LWDYPRCIKLDFLRFDVFFFDLKWFEDVLDKVPQGSVTLEAAALRLIPRRSAVPRKGPSSRYLIVSR
jgi:hypothetical protein